MGCKNLPAFTPPALSRAEAGHQCLRSLTALQKPPRFPVGSLAVRGYCPHCETGAARGHPWHPPRLLCLSWPPTSLRKERRWTPQAAPWGQPGLHAGTASPWHREQQHSPRTRRGCLLLTAAPASSCPRGLVTLPGVSCHLWIHNQCPPYVSLRGADLPMPLTNQERLAGVGSSHLNGRAACRSSKVCGDGKVRGRMSRLLWQLSPDESNRQGPARALAAPGFVQKNFQPSKLFHASSRCSATTQRQERRGARKIPS